MKILKYQEHKWEEQINMNTLSDKIVKIAMKEKELNR